jgi:hypothetical protein
MVSEFETGATDTEGAALSETRTARAFMLLGRGAGIFEYAHICLGPKGCIATDPAFV